MKYCATIERVVAVLERVRRRCNHPKTKQVRGRGLARAELTPRPTSKKATAWDEGAAAGGQERGWEGLSNSDNSDNSDKGETRGRLPKGGGAGTAQRLKKTEREMVVMRGISAIRGIKDDWRRR